MTKEARMTNDEEPRPKAGFVIRISSLLRHWSFVIRVSLGLALVGWLAGECLLRSWIAKPPPLPRNAFGAIRALKPLRRDGRVWLGKSWLGQRGGLPVLYL